MRQNSAPLGNFGALAAFLVLCLGVMAVGGAITSTTVGTWYETLEKPAFAPPDWVFGPVWTALYIMMAVAGWLVWQRAALRGSTLLLFIGQLGLNLAWSGLFFGMTWIGIAFLEILILWITIAATIRAFWAISRAAALLFVPYLLWVGYAAALNGALWALNGHPLP